jgi:hypothetical protein
MLGNQLINLGEDFPYKQKSLKVKDDITLKQQRPIGEGDQELEKRLV